MEKVDKHISALLYDHDCVIVPELGGFVANYAPAKIHPVQHLFTPPSKNIVFNKNLKNNDGLLASHIAGTENKTYPEALKYIQHFVQDTGLQLKKGGRVTIAEVGTLFLDVERNIQFEPDTTVNHLPEAFGLPGFQSPAIKRETIGKRIEKEFKDRKAIPAGRKKINVKRYVALAIAMPLIFAMVWVPLKTDLLKNINYSSLNPFASKTVKQPEPKALTTPVNTAASTPVAADSAATATLPQDTAPAETAVAGAPATAATPPWRVSAMRGPPATTTMKTPWSRPRTSSSAASWSIVERNAAEAMSAAPAIIRPTRHSHSQTPIAPSARLAATPETVMPAPQMTIATMTEKPWRVARETQPEKIPPRTAPAGIAAKSSANASPPSTGPPKLTCASCGNSARGMPNVIAMMSTTKLIRSTVLPRR